ncbi:MAG: PAS domain-containing protein [Ardenticatenaceae bacterium]|nr:PAS domain-containing protein [Ardenticatenaceae bacterium]
MDQRLRPLVGAGDGILAIDTHQCIVFWNEAAREILGYEAETVLGKPCWQFFEAFSPQEALLCRPDCPLIRQALHGQPIPPFELDARTQTGEHILLEVSVATFSGDATADEETVLVLFCRQLAAQMCPGDKLCLHLLGPLYVWRPDGSAVNGRNWQQIAVQTLLAVLAAQRGCVVSKPELQFQLWPNDVPQKRQEKFKSTVNSLCLCLEPHLPPSQSSYIVQDESGLCLTSSSLCWLDIEAFELDVCRARLETDTVEAVSRYRQALRLYRGPFVIHLPETADCLHQERARLHQLYLEALEEVGLLFEKLGRPHEALWYYCLALDSDPDCINIRRLLYRLLQTADEPRGSLVYSQWLVNCLKAKLDATVAHLPSFADSFEPGKGGYKTV